MDTSTNGKKTYDNSKFFFPLENRIFRFFSSLNANLFLVSPQSKDSEETIPLDAKEIVVLPEKPVMKVKPKLSVSTFHF